MAVPVRRQALPSSLRDIDPDMVIVAGPGLGDPIRQRSLVRRLWSLPNRLVLDGTGLEALAALPSLKARSAPTVLTPHPGEFRRLARGWSLPNTMGDHSMTAARTLARRCGATVVLKSHRTCIADPHRHAINDTGGPVLAIPGSGDVLAGMIGGLMCQGMRAFDAARLAAYLHGRAGETWASRHGQVGMLAMELAVLIPAELERYRRAAR